MPQVKTIDICKRDLFTSVDELNNKYDSARVAHLIRLRKMYDWVIQNPDKRDRQFIDQFRMTEGLSLSELYRDLGLIKQLLPIIHEASREFHRYRYNEMILETYQMAKSRKDVKTMEKAASSYAKFNHIDADDEKELPFDLIVVQPFTATEDPSILGIKPIPNRDEVVARLLHKYGADDPDIEDIEAEEVDLEYQELFPSTEQKTEEE